MTPVFVLCLLLLVIGTALWGMAGLVVSVIVSGILFSIFSAIEYRLSRIESKLNLTREPKTITPAVETPPEPKPRAIPQRKVEPEEPESHTSSFDPDKAILLVLKKVAQFVTTGNPIANIGVIILFIGVAFLFTYVSTFIHFTIELRLIGVALAGIVALILGWYLYATKPLFANILEGCGIGLLFLTTYAAFKVYALLSPLTAFSLLIAIILVSGTLAVLQNAKSLAILGVLGGFLAPILISTGSSDFVFLFSYYAVLNALILGIAWFKAWPELNLLGFVATFIISALWGWQAYQPEYFYVTEFFLSLFFLFYVAIAILYASRQERNSANAIDTIITLGTPFIVFALQIGLVNHYPYGEAWSAGVLCAFYAITGLIVSNLHYPAMKLLSRVFYSLALLFGTLAIPLASTENWTVFAWAFESIALLYIGIKYNLIKLRIAGAALQIGSGILFIINNSNDYFQLKPYLDNFYITASSVGLSGLVFGALWHHYANKFSRIEEDFAHIIFGWGVVWWYGTGIVDTWTHVSGLSIMRVITLFFAFSSIAFWSLYEFVGWRLMRQPALLLLLVMVFYLFSLISGTQTYDNDMLITWIISFVVLYAMLYRNDRHPNRELPEFHIVSLLLLTCVIAYIGTSVKGLYPAFSINWNYVIWGIVPILMLSTIRLKALSTTWPINHYQKAYDSCSAVLTGYLVLWIVVSFSLDGNLSPLSYIPLLNFIDIVTFLAFLVIYQQNIPHKDFKIMFGILFLIWINVVLLRTLHLYFNIPYTPNDLWNSATVQTALSIYWALVALIATFVATRIRSRMLWLFGFALIVAVVVKLFMIDLSSIGTLQRIITFITVGLLMLINGYISPIPPKDE